MAFYKPLVFNDFNVLIFKSKNYQKMKNLTLILIMMTFSILSCEYMDAQTVKGSGSIVSQTIDMDDISSLGLGISANVYVRQGSKQKIEIKGQQNIIDLINKKSRGNSWNIEFKRNVRIKSYEEIKIYVTLTELESLSIGGSGSIYGENKFTKVRDLGLSIGGSGDIELDVEADDISCSIGGSGKVDLKGSADAISISIGGSGDVNAIGLSVKNCDVSSAGSGNVDIDVSDNLKVSLVGSGDVKYKGKPKVKSSIVGSGDVDPY